jgi:hypothetical protein
MWNNSNAQDINRFQMSYFRFTALDGEKFPAEVIIIIIIIIIRGATALTNLGDTKLKLVF